MTTYRYNNFYCWFPEGYYRERAERNPSIIKNTNLVSDLDRILAEMNFNIGLFQHLRKRQHVFWKEVKGLTSIIKDGVELNPEQQKRLRELDIKNEIIYRILDMVLEPVYKRMRQVGYSHEELIT